MEYINWATENWEAVAIGLAALLYGVSHLLAIFGKPKWSERVKGVSEFLDGLGANYGKAKNK